MEMHFDLINTLKNHIQSENECAMNYPSYNSPLKIIFLIHSDEELSLEDLFPNEKRVLFQCHLFNCKIGFKSISSYEEHYEL
jgi:hypothetical protein